MCTPLVLLNFPSAPNDDIMTTRVTGIGGVFFKAKDSTQLLEWYVRHLGVPLAKDHPSAMFVTPSSDQPDARQFTAWAPFEESTTYFEPSQASFMINFTVADLEALLALLRAEGIAVVDGPVVETYGKFAWIMDPEGNKVELWEPAEPPADGDA